MKKITDADVEDDEELKIKLTKAYRKKNYRKLEINEHNTKSIGHLNCFSKYETPYHQAILLQCWYLRQKSDSKGTTGKLANCTTKLNPTEPTAEAGEDALSINKKSPCTMISRNPTIPEGKVCLLHQRFCIILNHKEVLEKEILKKIETEG